MDKWCGSCKHKQRNHNLSVLQQKAIADPIVAPHAEKFLLTRILQAAESDPLLKSLWGKDLVLTLRPPELEKI